MGQLKKLNAGDKATDPGDDQSMSLLRISEKIKEMRLKFSQVKVTVLWIMANYQEVGVKRTNTQLIKPNCAALK